VHSRSLGALCRRLNKQAGTGKLIVIEEEITDPAGTVPRGGARRRIILKSRESSSWMEKEKLDLLHHAAMTIGHEINDPLMIISAEAETIIKKYPGSKAEIISRMKEVSRAAARIAAVMEELRTIETISYRYLAGNRILDFDFGENRRGTGDGLFTRSPEFIA
jgi:signal transduction histidine kinase